MRRCLTLGLACLLAACAAPRDAEQRYMEFCAAQGLEPESDLWVHCIEAQRARDQLEAERIRSMRELRPDPR